MSSDEQFTALGPAIIGFQTHGSNIEVGADVQGNKAGIKGYCKDGVGVEESGIVGVRGEGTWGMFGVGQDAGVVGVRQGKRDGSGVQGVHSCERNIDSPVSPGQYSKMPDPGAGVYGFSDCGLVVCKTCFDG